VTSTCCATTKADDPWFVPRWPRASGQEREADLLYWTRYYERRMGLRQGDVHFVGAAPFCGMVTVSPEWHGVITVFDLRAACSRWPARDLALHEACHRRYAHLFVDHITDERKHEEVAECARAYR